MHSDMFVQLLFRGDGAVCVVREDKNVGGGSQPSCVIRDSVASGYGTYIG